MNSLRLITYLAATVAAIGSAYAGGYSRGTADTDLIFEEGNFNMRSGVTMVMPQRGYATVTAPTTTAPYPGHSAADLQRHGRNTSRPTQFRRAAVKFNLSTTTSVALAPIPSHSVRIRNMVRRPFLLAQWPTARAL